MVLQRAALILLFSHRRLLRGHSCMPAHATPHRKKLMATPTKCASLSRCHIGWVCICMSINAWQPEQKTHDLLCLSKMHSNARRTFCLGCVLICAFPECMTTRKKMHALPCVSKMCGNAHHVCVTICLHLPVSKSTATCNKKMHALPCISKMRSNQRRNYVLCHAFQKQWQRVPHLLPFVRICTFPNARKNHKKTHGTLALFFFWICVFLNAWQPTRKCTPCHSFQKRMSMLIVLALPFVCICAFPNAQQPERKCMLFWVFRNCTLCLHSHSFTSACFQMHSKPQKNACFATCFGNVS